MPKQRTRQSVRIIGGKFRGRKLEFPAAQGLRPTLGRSRETLFNWLLGVLPESHCLDLFAGSGALGFEALSRGAAQVVLVEQQRAVCQALQASAAALQLAPQEHSIVQSDASGYLQRLARQQQRFDIIFLDPPFAGPALTPLLEQLRSNSLLQPDGRVYFECAAATDLDTAGLTLLRHNRSGDYQYGLLSLP